MTIDTFLRSKLTNHERLNNLASWALTPVRYFGGQRVIEIVDKKVIEQIPLHFRYKAESWKKTALMVALFIPSLILGTALRTASCLTSSEVRASFATPRDTPPSGSSTSTTTPVTPLKTDNKPEDTPPSGSSTPTTTPVTPSKIDNKPEDIPPSGLSTPTTTPVTPLKTDNKPEDTPLSGSSTSTTTPVTPSKIDNKPEDTLLSGSSTSTTTPVIPQQIDNKPKNPPSEPPSPLDSLRKTVFSIFSSKSEKTITKITERLNMNDYHESLKNLSSDKNLSEEQLKTYCGKASSFFKSLTELKKDQKTVEERIQKEIKLADYGQYFYKSFILMNPLPNLQESKHEKTARENLSAPYTKACRRLIKLNLGRYLYEGLEKFVKPPVMEKGL